MVNKIVCFVFLYYYLELLLLFSNVGGGGSVPSPSSSSSPRPNRAMSVFFRRLEEGLLKDHRHQVDEEEEKEEKGIPLDRSWLFESDLRTALSERVPTHLPTPTFVQVYELQEEISEEGEESPQLLEDLAQAARDIINHDLPQHGAVLLRNLHYQIKSASDFASFWQTICDVDDNDGDDWTPVKYIPLGKGRETLNGLDLATNIPPQYPLRCHNEMAYNPNPPSRIAFYCLQDAKKGGETIVCRNVDLTDSMRDDIIQHVKEHGILYERRYPTLDQNSDQSVGEAALSILSWQEKCETNDKKQAIEFFIDAGFSETDIWFEEDETLVVSNQHSGFWSEEEETRISTTSSSSSRGRRQRRDLWFNVLPFATFAKRASDGTEFPSDMCAQIRLDGWNAVHAFKLRPGDWLILNNRTVQHGRLPYQENEKGTRPRTLLTVYTK